jgi:hypothetical protein
MTLAPRAVANRMPAATPATDPLQAGGVADAS